MNPIAQVSQTTPTTGTEHSGRLMQLLVFVGILFGLAGATTAWADDAIEIERANWSNDRDRLTVRGKNAPNNATVTIRYGKIEDNGAELGTARADSDGDWTFRFTNPGPDPVPCDVTAQAGGNADDKNVRRAPDNCSNDGGGQPPPPVEPPPVAQDVSINSTSQNCGSADVSGNGVACNENAVGEQPIVGNTGDHTIVAINDLGMHCGDLDTRISSILPPFQVLLAQVIRKGAEPEILSPDQVELFYSAASNPTDPILSVDPNIDDVFRGLTADGSIYKTNFWDYPVPGGTYDAFYPAFNPFPPPAFDVTPLAGPPFNITYDVGLPVPNLENFYFSQELTAVTQNMPGILDPYVANAPQEIQEHLRDKPFFTSFPFGYVANDINWFEAAGPPFAAYDDAGRENPYPLVRVQATTNGDPPNPDGSNVVATVDTVLPISGEASCRNCHASSMDGNFGPVRTTDPEDELEAAGLPVVDSETDPLLIAGSVPVDVAVEWATDINVLRLHDLKHGDKYVPFCDGSVTPCPEYPPNERCTINAANPNGSPSCLTNQALVQNKPVVCQVCHYTPALDLAQLGPLAGEPGTIANGRNQIAHQSNSRVMHNHHGQFTELFPSIDPPQQDANGAITNQEDRLTALEQNCYQCHPGKNTQCMRGAMFNGGMVCSDCHGSLEQVGADFTGPLIGDSESEPVSPSNPGDFKLKGPAYPTLGDFYTDSRQPRVPWANEPGCGSCHTGDANDNAFTEDGQPMNVDVELAEVIVNKADVDKNVDNIRLRQAFRIGDVKATPIVPSNKRFAEPEVPEQFNGTPNNGAGNPKLYRVSTGHGGVMCEGCHGATHAEWPNGNPKANDNVTAMQLQGHTGTISDCTTCHVTSQLPDDTQDGPHGMHLVDDRRFWKEGHKDLAKRENSRPGGGTCGACHGSDHLGTVLSRAAADRSFNVESRNRTVAAGEPVACDLCHSLEKSFGG